MEEHLEMVERCGARGIAVKRPAGLSGVSGLIVPGGESTVIGKLIQEYGFALEIARLAASGVPVYGTCAGLIVLAKSVVGKHGPVLSLMDVTVERNAFGRQVDSFEKDVMLAGIDEPEKPFRAVFIRAPIIEEAGFGVEVMGRVERGIAMARQGNLLASAFHPELTDDERVHRYFVQMAAAADGARDVEV